MGFLSKIEADEPRQSLTGRKIKKIRPMTAGEMDAEGWSSRFRPTVIELDNGCIIFASRDPEGNDPGNLFGVVDGQQVALG